MAGRKVEVVAEVEESAESIDLERITDRNPMLQKKLKRKSDKKAVDAARTQGFSGARQSSQDEMLSKSSLHLRPLAKSSLGGGGGASISSLTVNRFASKD